jgi:regulator of protease activity HflC (stomatin/prohibitin superfamily)
MIVKNISADIRGMVYSNGDYKRLLMPGKHYISPFSTVELRDATKPIFGDRNLSVYLSDKEFANEVTLIDVTDNCICLHFENDRFLNVLGTERYAYWKTNLVTHKFEMVDLNDPEIASSIDPSLFSKAGLSTYIQSFSVEPSERGLLFIDRKYIKALEPGEYNFWKGTKKILVLKAELRQQQMDVSGQEIMTKDKVSLRLNFVCQYRITNPYKALVEIKDYTQQLYVVMQLALREYVGSLTLDEILEKKEQIGIFVTEKVQQQADDLGMHVAYSGVKDIILPGDVKDIINQVLIAEKKAQANVIMRREETASTRSLLNTAKLMEDNELLFKLKELEYVERISEKINQISISGGGVQFLEQLKQVLLPLKSNKD